MFTRAVRVAAMGSALAAGCVGDEGEGDKTKEIVDNLVQAGFPQGDIMVVHGDVFVGRDAKVTLEASREMLQGDESCEAQYRTRNLVSPAISKICIVPSADFTGTFSLALDFAIANYNAQPLTFDFGRWPTTGCQVFIYAYIQPGLVGGSAGFPSGGRPYSQVFIGGGLAPYGVDVIEHVITHELGHTIGFRHSDFYNRSISCGAGGNEGDAGVGAIHVPGTPTAAWVGGSIMSSCFRTVETGELTSSDLTALNYLY